MLEDAKLLDDDYEEGSNRTWSPTITVDGLTYATSLFWQPLQNTEDPVAEVSEAAEGIMEGADLFCIKQGKAPQFGICASNQGFKSGMSVGAISVATALGAQSSFVAVFKVNTGWWYICVRNDIILSDGDMVFLKEEDAKNQFLSMLAVPDWGKKIAPEEWGIEGTESEDVADLIKKGMRAKLQKIKALRGAKLFMVIAISAIVGIWLLSTIIDSIFLAPPKRPMVAPIKPKVVKAKPKIPEIKPWEKLKDAGYIMAKCYDNIAALSQIMPPGWTIGELTCNGSGKIPTTPSKPDRTTTELKMTLNDLFQAIGQPVALSETSFTSAQNNIYRSIRFKFTSVNNPIVWKDLLTKFSGLEITMIKYHKDGEKWDYEGAIYAK